MRKYVAAVVGAIALAACSGGDKTSAGTGGAASSAATGGSNGAGGNASSTGSAMTGAAGGGGSVTGGGCGTGGSSGAGGSGASDAGSGKSTYSCPSGGIPIHPNDDIDAIVASAAAGAKLCIFGEHRPKAPLVPKKDQTWIGVDTTARLNGAQTLDTWSPAGSGVWVYTGTLALPDKPHRFITFSTNTDACYPVSTYQDDVFYGDQRMMRVLSLAELKGTEPLPKGQKATQGEKGRFFFDYGHHKIYIDQDPSCATVELATLDTMIMSGDPMSPGSGVAGVTLENLVIEKVLSNAVVARAASWTFTDMTIRFAHLAGAVTQGGTAASPTHFLRTILTNNGQYGVTSGGSFVVVEDSEISWNNIANYRQKKASGDCGGYWAAGATKFVLASDGNAASPSLVIRNVDSHHNIGDGGWTDVRNQFVSIHDNHFHDNERHGYVHEISCDVEFFGNEFDHNGTPLKNDDMSGYGLWISDSNNGDVHDNNVHDNAGGGIALNWQMSHTGLAGLACLGCPSDPSCDADTSKVLKNNAVHANTISSCTGQTGEIGADTIADRGNSFVANAYHVPDTGAGTWWIDSTKQTWSEWQAAHNDTAGSASTPCTP